MRGLVCTVVLGAALAPAASLAVTYNATPATYQGLLGSLQAGDVLNLAAGTYPLLNVGGLTGNAPARIIIQGPPTGSPAIVTINASNPDCCNVVQLTGASFVTLRNLTIDSALRPFVDGLKANGITHHIEVIDCTFAGQGSHQQTVAISTKGTAWNWVVRGNVITEAGTGMYFGNSDGTAPFVNGIVENNLVVDTIGYNVQFKYQVPYARPAMMGPGPHRTIIRNNVFIKTRSQGSWNPAIVDGARPNLLVGGFPTSGFGADDLYDIHGNFFYQNADGEPLVQASGRAAAHDNVLVGGTFRALSFVNHDLPLRRAYAYNNTIYNVPSGIAVVGGPLEDSRVSGNLVFATNGVNAPTQQDNLVDTVANAGLHVGMPSMALGAMDFFPLPGMATGTPLDMSSYATHVQIDRDFNDASKGAFTRRGAYAGQGANPGWALAAARKPYVAPAASADPDADGVPNAVEDAEGLNLLVKDNDIFGVARLFAMQQYRDFLGREGEAAGIDFFVNLLNTGAAVRGNVVESFFNSPEFQGSVSPIVRLYFATFLRIPDYPGLIFQTNAFRAGTPLEVIANNFTLSPEFQATYGALDNAQYVVLLYQNILNRTPSQGEIDFHVARLVSGVTRGAVLVGFSESPEYQQASAIDVYVAMMYVGMLRRAPEQAGFDFWKAYMQAGNPGLALILGFLQAPEYRGRFLP